VSIDNNQHKIFQIGLGFSKCFFVKSPDHGVLIDAGQKGKWKRFVSFFSKHKIDLQAIDLIIVTHSHHDHVGLLADIQACSEAKILIQHQESALLEKGISMMPKGRGWLGQMVAWIGNRLYPKGVRFKAVQPDLVYDELYSLSAWGIDGRVLHTPGHTAGSSTVIVGDHAFVGDSCFHLRPNSIYPFLGNDPQALLESWKKLIDTGCRYFHPAHGFAIKRETLIKHYHKRI